MPATVTRSIPIGCGGYVPEKCLHNKELSSLVDTSDEWIWQRTGIRQRHIAADGELTSDLATHAAKAALEDAGISADEIDLLIVATCTPDDTFPSTATTVQTKLGMTGGAAFDIHAVCSGFVYALSVADSMLKNAMGATAMVIGAETLSRIVDWTDRTSCVLFGDGAGAVVLRAEPGTGATDDRGVLATTLHSDGRLRDLLYTDGGPSSTRTTGLIRMQGKEVYRHAVTKLTSVVAEVLDVAGLTPRRHRLGCASPGERADHRQRGAEAGSRCRSTGRHGRPARQHIVGIHPPRTVGGRRRRARQTRATCSCWKRSVGA